MIEMKTSELIGPALDWAVAKALGWVSYPTDSIEQGDTWHIDPGTAPFGPVIKVAGWRPSTNWSQGGPLLKPNRISLTQKHSGWVIACIYDSNDEPTHMQLAEDPLIAAMRCLCASKLGDTVQVPQELLP